MQHTEFLAAEATRLAGLNAKIKRNERERHDKRSKKKHKKSRRYSEGARSTEELRIESFCVASDCFLNLLIPLQSCSL
eukprot:2590725-Pleurochrysis_carterae.AAC.1